MDQLFRGRLADVPGRVLLGSMEDSFDIDNTSVCIHAVNKETVPMYDQLSGIAFTPACPEKEIGPMRPPCW